MHKKQRKSLTAIGMATVLLVGAIFFTDLPMGLLTARTDAAATILAFPGAVGGGSHATGGRGGKIVHVTNLNDSGTGSFREAVSKSNSIVVFDVGGTIALKSDVVVSSNVTIAGQTAPGGSGITLKNYKLGLGGSNIICRYISSRPGERGTNADYDALGGANGANSIIDHCSFGWANDEQWGLYSKNDNYTVQYSVIGPSNSFSYHSKGIHGFGIMLGRSNVTWDHNLIVHNVSRNFRGKIPGTGVADFTNNVIYNWGSQTTYGTIGHVNYVGNTLKSGKSTISGYHYVSVGDSGTDPENYSIYLTGNRFLNQDNTNYKTFTDNNWAGMTYSSSSKKTEANTRSNSPFSMTVNGINVSTSLTAEPAADAYEHVISYAGNGITSEKRTAIDRQVAEETRTGTGTLTGARPYGEASSSQKTTIDSYQMQCGVTYSYPSAVLKKEIKDSDNDGMPDEWEINRGLNPISAGDAMNDYLGKGYTNIEYYLNDLTIDSFPPGTVTLSPELKTATPAPTATPTTTPTSTPTTVPTATPTATPTVTPTATPTSTPTTMPTVTPTATPTTTPTVTPTTTPTATPTATPTTPPTVMPTILYGDLDRDNRITLDDVRTALKVALTIIIPTNYETVAADVDFNGSIDLDDVQSILKSALTITEINPHPIIKQIDLQGFFPYCKSTFELIIYNYENMRSTSMNPYQTAIMPDIRGLYSHGRFPKAQLSCRR